MFRDGGDLGLCASEKIKVQYCSIDFQFYTGLTDIVH